MSVSRFMLLLGRGGRYDGEGLVPEALLTLYDDKAVWRYDSFWAPSNSYVWASADEHLFDDALLMANLYYLGGGAENLYESAAKFFKKDIYQGDPINTGRHINKKNLRLLYETNRKVLGKQNVKIVAVFLGSLAIHMGGVEVEGLKERFIQIAEAYCLPDVEICEPTYGVFCHMRFPEPVTY
jgi:hypothetical protein